jgi:uncharacterized protein with PIN domain
MAEEPRFLCDHMLGSLARWLRFLGYDTLYPQAMKDTDILCLAETEGRILLTRDKELAARARGRGHLVTSVVLRDQIAQVRGELKLEPAGGRPLSRCSLCNSVLVGVSTEEAKDAGAPPAVLLRHDTFWRCPGCGQIYWPGSHYDSIIEKIKDIEDLK